MSLKAEKGWAREAGKSVALVLYKVTVFFNTITFRYNVVFTVKIFSY